MKKILIWILLLLAAGSLLRVYRGAKDEIARLEANQSALNEALSLCRGELDDSVASCRVLRLRCGEFEELRAQDAAEIRRLGIRLKRAEAVARNLTNTQLQIALPLRDTIRLYDTVQLFRWHDPWVEVEGVVSADSVRCRVRSVDTLVQVIHRVPHRLWFIRWGTKAIRQEIVSKNPHTRVVYAEYIAIKH